MIRFDKVRELVLAKNPDVEDIHYNDYNEICVTYKNSNKLYTYKYNNYMILLNKLGVKACYKRDVAYWKSQLQYYKENHGKETIFGKLDYAFEIEQLTNNLEKVENGYYDIII